MMTTETVKLSSGLVVCATVHPTLSCYIPSSSFGANNVLRTDASTKTEYSPIVCTPGVVSGESRIGGHSIDVSDIVAARDLGGLTPTEMATSVYPELTLAQVYSALAYYEDHRHASEQAILQ
jgi:uncharacterized protein (DUF433 family)